MPEWQETLWGWSVLDRGDLGLGLILEVLFWSPNHLAITSLICLAREHCPHPVLNKYTWTYLKVYYLELMVHVQCNFCAKKTSLLSSGNFLSLTISHTLMIPLISAAFEFVIQCIKWEKMLLLYQARRLAARAWRFGQSRFTIDL